MQPSLTARAKHRGGDASGWFHDLLPKRQFADYYKQIKNPQALNPVQSNVKRRTYTSVADFVKDCTQVGRIARETEGGADWDTRYSTMRAFIIGTEARFIRVQSSLKAC